MATVTATAGDQHEGLDYDLRFLHSQRVITRGTTISIGFQLTTGEQLSFTNTPLPRLSYDLDKQLSSGKIPYTEVIKEQR